MSKRIVNVLVSVGMLVAGLASASVDAPVTNGLLIALDGSDVTSSGGTVSSWNDQSVFGGAEDFTNNTVSKQPALIENYEMPNGTTHNVLDFDQASIDILTHSDDSSFETNTFTTIAIVRAEKMDDGVSGYYFCCGYTDISAGLWGSAERSTDNTWFFFARNDLGDMKGLDLTVNADETNRWYMVMQTWDGASGTVVGRILDETGVLRSGSVGAATATPTNHLYSRIGATTYTATGGNAFDGQIAEFLVYNRVITGDETREIERYLKRKYFINRSAMPPVTNGLLIKLDGTDVTLSDGKVSSWHDQAELGGEEDFSNSTASKCPVLKTDFMMPKGVQHNVVDFDLANIEMLTLSGDSNFETNTFTSFAVVYGDKMGDTTSGYFLMNGYNDISTGLWGIGERSTDNTWLFFSRNDAGDMKSVDLTVGSEATNRWQILSMTWDGVSGLVAGSSIDDTGVKLTGSVTGATTASPTNHLYCRVGATTYSSTGNYPFDGRIAEILIYNRVLSDSERVDVEDFLKYKYFMNRGTVIVIK